jgi:aspartyl-tRNA(Asn)/glutamyl-tRNA(Gln) amidotransferase subunit C
LPIDAEQVKHIAKLARLDLDDVTVERLRHELQTILEHVALLDEVDVDSIPPTVTPLARAPRLREDQVAQSVGTESALRNAPDSAAGHFRVPRVLGE